MSVCLCVARARKCGFSVSQSHISGLPFPHLSRVGEALSGSAAQPWGSRGPSGQPALCCPLPPRLGASGAGKGRACPGSGSGAEGSQPVTAATAASRREARPRGAPPGCTGDPARRPPTRLRGPPSFPQIAKQSLRPFCTVCNRYFKTPRKFVEHVKSQEHKDKAKELKMFEKEMAGQDEDHFITVDAVGCFEDGEEGKGGRGVKAVRRKPGKSRIVLKTQSPNCIPQANPVGV